VASAAIDLSDGLFGDLGKLLAASGCGGRLDLDRLPVSSELAARYPRAKQLRFALAGGDDYELCFTAPGGSVPAARTHAVTAIGSVVRGKGIACCEAGEPYDFSDQGYLHFA
jgi:thiamine-monophosphate kinase